MPGLPPFSFWFIGNRHKKLNQKSNIKNQKTGGTNDQKAN